MEKINFFLQSNWKILGLCILSASCFSLAFLPEDPALKSIAGTELTCSLPSGEAGAMALANTTFLKSYRLLVFTKINSVWPTKDGGYIVSGTTDPNIMFIPPDGFVAKLDKKGDIQWLKLLKTTNAGGAGNPLGDEDVQSIIELKNGGYLMASKVWGFITAKEWSSDSAELNKIMFTKLDKNGNTIWSKSITAFVEDAKNSLLETADSGFLFYTNIVDLAPDKRGEDSDVYQDQPYASLKVFKFDKNGVIQWSKNIKNFISRKNDSYLVSTPDGGYALAGNITQTNSEKIPPYNYDTYPGFAKFNKNFDFEWARSLEGIPLEMATVIFKPNGVPEMGWKEVRQGASIIHGLIQTQDKGYLVLGIGPAALSLVTDSQGLNSNSKPKGSFVGFKFDSLGNMEWVKKMTLSFNDFTSPVTDFSLSPTADNKMIITGPILWADNDYQEKIKKANADRDLYCEKYQISEEWCKANIITNIEDSEQTKQDWEKVHEAYVIVQDSFRPGIFVMKTDQELNASWAKIINPHRGAINYSLKPTSDSGVIIAGEYETTVVQSVILDSVTYYKDGFLIKMDASGNVKNDADWIQNYDGEIVTEMMTPYATSMTLSGVKELYSVKLTNRAPTFSLYKKAKTTAYSTFNSSLETLCPFAPAVSAHDAPLQNSTLASTARRTWPQIYYERAVPVEPITDKSLIIHNDLLPILNQIFDNRIKLTDNMSGTMLSYMFSSIITKDDVIEVKNYLEGLGYKTYDEGTSQLTMYKPGYFLVLTFSTNNKDKAFLDVTY